MDPLVPTACDPPASDPAGVGCGQASGHHPDQAGTIDRAQALLEAAAMGLWEWEAPGGRLTWSPLVGSLLALAPAGRRTGRIRSLERLLQRILVRRLPDDDRLRLLAALRRLLAGGKDGGGDQFAIEHRIRRGPGRDGWLESRARIERDGDGRPLRLTGTVGDITGRKHAEEELRASETRLALIFATTTDMVALLAVAGDGWPVTSVNRALAEALRRGGFRCSAGTLAGRDLAQVLGGDLGLEDRVVDSVLAEFRVVARGRPRQWQLAVPTPAGALHLEASLVPVRTGDGTVTHLLWTGRDVSDRIAAETALRASEAELREIFLGTGDCIFTVEVGESGILRYGRVNPQVGVATGLPPGRWTGRRPEEIFPPDVAQGFVGHYRDCIAAGGPIHYEELVPTPRGRSWFHTALVPVRDEEERIVRLIGVSRDVTAGKNLAEATRQMADDLERRVQERTAELAAANHELAAFAYSVSHDLRAPLRAIDGFSYLLGEEFAESLGDHGSSLVGRVRANAQRMGRLIDDLLTLSQVTRGGLSREPVDLTALAGQVVADLRDRAPDRLVEVEIAPGLGADADPGLARIVLENLLGNAWKFTRARSPAHIGLAACPVDGRPGFVVADDGVGFDPAFASKLFTAFQRLHSPGEFEGSGIGLATVHRIISRHGGRITADGAIGQGARFRFTFAPG